MTPLRSGLARTRAAFTKRLGTINRAAVVLAAIVLALYALLLADRQGRVPLPPLVAGSLATVIVIVGSYLVATIILRFTVRRVTRAFRDFEVEQRLIVSKGYGLLIYVLATAYSLWQLGVSPESITLFLGFATTGVAFAIREVILSYFVWFMLLTKRPFRIGDHIRVGEEEGLVKHIGTFYVLLDATPDTAEDYVRVPNRLFLEKPITNLGRGRFRFAVSVPFPPDGPGKAYVQRHAALAAELARATGQDLVPRFDASKERVLVRVEAEAGSYEERDRLRDAIIGAVLGAR